MLARVLAGEEFNPGKADSGQMTDWGDDRTVRASVLCPLLTGKDLPPQGVRLRHVRISGQLNLRSATVRRPLHLTSCYLDSPEPVILDYAKVSLLVLDHCRLSGGLRGDTLVVTKGLEFTGSMFERPVLLPDASIHGHFRCTKAHMRAAITDPQAIAEYGGSYALIGDGMTVSGDVRLDGNKAREEARSDATEVVWPDEEFRAAGVLLSGAHIGGTLDIGGARLENAKPGAGGGESYCFRGSGMKVDGDVIFDKCIAEGNGIRLSDADIAGELICHGTELKGAGKRGDALRANNIKVGSNVSLLDMFTADGKISLRQAVIGGDLCVKPERLGQDEKGVAFDATGTQVTQRLVWSPQEQVRGKVILERMVVSQLDDDWKYEDGHPRRLGYWPTGGMLRLDGLTYGGISRITSNGKEDANERLKWIRWQYESPDKIKAATKARRHDMRVAATRTLRHYKRGAVAEAVRDVERKHAAERPVFATQPYRQLADVYRAAGRNADARRVAIAQRRDLRAFGNLTPWAKVGNWLLDNTIRYGYRTWHAAIALAVLYAAVAAFFFVARSHGALVAVQATPNPTSATSSVSQPASAINSTSPDPAKCTASYPCFNTFGYTIDTVIPLINVHQSDLWAPNAHAKPPWDWLSVWITYVSTGLGWLLATLAVAGYTGLARNASSP